jgi:hypothetical protein
MTAPDHSSFAHAHQALKGQGDFQFSFPTYVPPKEPEWVKALGQFLHDHGRLLGWIAWIVVGALALYLLYRLAMTYGPDIVKWRPGKKPEKTLLQQTVTWRPTEVQARQLLKESDTLAAEGRYSEAVHLLLLRSIEDIQARRAGLLRPTLTSREIAMLRALPGPARQAFTAIANVVERGRFAALPIGADDFRRCRQEYESFALPNWSMA